MGTGSLHRAVDAFAVWTEDLVSRAPEPCRLVPPEPLGCFGPLPALPRTAPRDGPWSAPSPRPAWEGDRLAVQALPAGPPRRGVVVVVPPWKIRGLGPLRGWLGVVRRAGHDAWAISPPHHLERVAPGGRSGEGFVSLDLARLRATFEQLVLEIRTCVALARADGAREVGLLGLSLGALAAALAATAPEPLDLAALVAPPYLPAVMATTGIGRRYQRLAARAGSRWPGDDALAAALAPLDPAARPPAARRVLVAQGAHDAISPPEGQERLARAWGLTPRRYPRGHLTLLFACRAVRRDVSRFLAGGAAAGSDAALKAVR